MCGIAGVLHKYENIHEIKCKLDVDSLIYLELDTLCNTLSELNPSIINCIRLRISNINIF